MSSAKARVKVYASAAAAGGFSSVGAAVVAKPQFVQRLQFLALHISKPANARPKRTCEIDEFGALLDLIIATQFSFLGLATSSSRF